MHCAYALREADFRGTLAPARRASDSPMAIACFGLVTFLPDRPLRSVPCFISSMARSTLRPLALLYLRAMTLSMAPRGAISVWRMPGTYSSHCQRSTDCNVGLAKRGSERIAGGDHQRPGLEAQMRKAIDTGGVCGQVGAHTGDRIGGIQAPVRRDLIGQAHSAGWTDGGGQ